MADLSADLPTGFAVLTALTGVADLTCMTDLLDVVTFLLLSIGTDLPGLGTTLATGLTAGLAAGFAGVFEGMTGLRLTKAYTEKVAIFNVKTPKKVNAGCQFVCKLSGRTFGVQSLRWGSRLVLVSVFRCAEGCCRRCCCRVCGGEVRIIPYCLFFRRIVVGQFDAEQLIFVACWTVLCNAAMQQGQCRL